MRGEDVLDLVERLVAASRLAAGLGALLGAVEFTTTTVDLAIGVVTTTDLAVGRREAARKRTLHALRRAPLQRKERVSSPFGNVCSESGRGGVFELPVAVREGRDMNAGHERSVSSPVAVLAVGDRHGTDGAAVETTLEAL